MHRGLLLLLPTIAALIAPAVAPAADGAGGPPPAGAGVPPPRPGAHRGARADVRLPGGRAPNPAYNRLIDLKRRYESVPIWVIVNPASGPGERADANYARAVDRLAAPAAWCWAT